MMRHTKILTIISVLCFLAVSNSAQAQHSPTDADVLKFCEVKYNGQQRLKNCACMAEKYRAEEAKIIEKKQAIPEKGDVFAKLEFECHEYQADGFEEYKECLKSSSARKIVPNANQREQYCGCYAQNLENVPQIFMADPNLAPNAMQEMRKPMLKMAAEKCKAQIDDIFKED